MEGRSAMVWGIPRGGRSVEGQWVAAGEWMELPLLYVCM